MRKLFALIAAIALLFNGAVYAQSPTPSVPGPYNIDLGAVLKATLATGWPSGQTSGTTTYNSPTGSNYAVTPLNLAYNGVICVLEGTGYSGSPSVSWGIQQYDAATNSYLTALSQSVAYSALNPATPNVLEISAGVQTSSLPANMAAIQLRVPRVWRAYVTIGGSLAPALTYSVGCNFVK